MATDLPEVFAAFADKHRPKHFPRDGSARLILFTDPVTGAKTKLSWSSGRLKGFVAVKTTPQYVDLLHGSGQRFKATIDRGVITEVNCSDEMFWLVFFTAVAGKGVVVN